MESKLEEYALLVDGLLTKLDLVHRHRPFRLAIIESIRNQLLDLITLMLETLESCDV